MRKLIKWIKGELAWRHLRRRVDMLQTGNAPRPWQALYNDAMRERQRQVEQDAQKWRDAHGH